MKARFGTISFHNPGARIRRRAAGFWTRRRLEIRHGVRISAAGLLSYVAAELFALPQSYWAVFTAVLVVQGSVGGSWKASVDRLVGTMLGAAYGALVATAIPHDNALALGVAVTISLVPLAMLAAFNPAYRVAPITAMILLLGSTGALEGPVRAAMLRTLEVALGAICGMGVSLYVFPARAHALLGDAANTALQRLSELYALLFAALLVPQNPQIVTAKQDAARIAITNLESIAAEAARERRNRLSEDVDPEPIARTLRRVRYDLVSIGRIASDPLPVQDRHEIHARLLAVAEAGPPLLSALGSAFSHRRAPPSAAPLQQSIQQLVFALQESPNDERLVAMRLSLQQMQSNLDDLRQRAEEFAAVRADETRK